jgi:putative multiple sugar transport system substrate-binding protein
MKKPAGPYNIELFAGSPDDNNAKVFFDGAMEVLKPKIDDGTLKVVSGQTTSSRPSPRAGRPRTRRSAWTPCSPVLHRRPPPSTASCPPTTPWPARSSPRSRPPASRSPVVTGQDSEVESVKSIMAGEQYSTINKDTRKLVEETIAMVVALQKGEEPTITDTSPTTTASRSSRPTCSSRSSSPRPTPPRPTPTTRCSAR